MTTVEDRQAADVLGEGEVAVLAVPVRAELQDEPGRVAVGQLEDVEPTGELPQLSCRLPVDRQVRSELAQLVRAAPRQ